MYSELRASTIEHRFSGLKMSIESSKSIACGCTVAKGRQRPDTHTRQGGGGLGDWYVCTGQGRRTGKRRAHAGATQMRRSAYDPGCSEHAAGWRRPYLRGCVGKMSRHGLRGFTAASGGTGPPGGW